MQLIKILNRCHRFRDLFISTPGSVQTKGVSRSRCGPQGLGRDLFALPSAGPRLRPTRRAALRVHPSLGMAEAFRTSWDKVFDAVEHVVTFGLEHRTLVQIDAIGVDEIRYAKGHKYLALVYQIDLGVTRLLWVGKERTIESFQGFFTTIGEEITSKIVFVCSDMWELYLKVIREKCPEALHSLYRFHIVAKMSKALDEVRAGESRRMASGRCVSTVS